MGPFGAKNFGTSISPWVVTMEALEPFKLPNQTQEPAPLKYLAEDKPVCYNIELEVCPVFGWAFLLCVADLVVVAREQFRL